MHMLADVGVTNREVGLWLAVQVITANAGHAANSKRAWVRILFVEPTF
jgi:hypothetical protein